MKISTRSITLAATLAALCAVTGFIPFVFFLPVMVAATTLSLGMAAFVGLAFGAISVAYCFVQPMSLVSMAFVQAPYIALFPRMLAAMGACLVYKASLRIAKPQKRAARFACASIGAATGSLLNTALVVGLMVSIMPDMSFNGITVMLYVPEMLISGAIELACMAALAPPVALTLDRVVLKKRIQPPPQTPPQQNTREEAGK